MVIEPGESRRDTNTGLVSRRVKNECGMRETMGYWKMGDFKRVCQHCGLGRGDVQRPTGRRVRWW